MTNKNIKIGRTVCRNTTINTVTQDIYLLTTLCTCILELPTFGRLYRSGKAGAEFLADSSP